MSEMSRRDLIRGAAIAGAAAAASATSAGMASADAVAKADADKITAAQADAAAKRHGRFGDLRDIKRVMILMQENRSFDHYFGTMRA